MSDLQVGEIKDFDVKCFIDAANELVRSDEIKRAIDLLDNLPGFYRDYPPKEVKELRDLILSRICTPTTYAFDNNSDLLIDPKNANNMDKSLRGMIAVNDVTALNEKGFTPHICDMAPGEFWLPMMLKNKGLKFTYQSIHLHHRAYELALPHFKEHVIYPDPKEPKIFFALEIIEHLWNVEDIKTEMLQKIGFADVINISTPCYTFDSYCPKDWANYEHRKILGHLRTYTPREFARKIADMLPEYDSVLYTSEILHCRLINKSCTNEYLNETRFKPVLN